MDGVDSETKDSLKAHYLFHRIDAIHDICCSDNILSGVCFICCGQESLTDDVCYVNVFLYFMDPFIVSY